jgi:protein pelota
MRLIKQNVERDGSGSITLFPEEPEDMVRASLIPCDFARSADPMLSGTHIT